MQHHTETLGEYLNQARKHNGFSFHQLAVLAHMPKTTVIRLCQDRVRTPNPQQLVRLAEQLELPSQSVFAHAGIQLPAPTQAPVSGSLDAHLRAEYDLTDWEAQEARQSIVRIIEKHRARRQRIQDNSLTSPTAKGGNHDHQHQRHP